MDCLDAGSNAPHVRGSVEVLRLLRSAVEDRGARGVDPELIRELEALYGFDKPAHVRFFDMIGRYLRFDFGESF